MASVLEASAHVPEPGWELLSPKHGVVEGSSCQGTRPKGTRPKAQAGILLFSSGRPGGHCGFVPLVVPRSQVQGTAGALSLLTATAKGIKQSFFFFLPGTPKGLRVGFPQAPSSVSWEHPCHPAGPQRALKRGAMPTETHFQPCKSTGVAQTSSSHLRNAPLKFPRKAAAIPQVASSSTQGDISPT